MKDRLEVYEVRLDQVRSWIQGCYDTDTRLKFASMDSQYPMVGDYVVVTCCSDFGAFDGQNDDEKVWFGGIYIYDGLDVAIRRVNSGYQRYFAKLADGSVDYGLEWEVWHVVPNDPKPYYYADDEPAIYSDDTYFTESDEDYERMVPSEREERYVLVENLEPLPEGVTSGRMRHYWLCMCGTESQAQRLFWHLLTDTPRGMTHVMRLCKADAAALVPDAFRPNPRHGQITFDTDPVDHLTYHRCRMEVHHG